MSNRKLPGQASSDPLPYVQLDRALKPKAVALAQLMNVTPQHATGTLVEFWNLNGDVRDLERAIVAGVHEVVASADVLERRFRLASGGYSVALADLVALGLLEERGEQYRVRGMSRYFKPLERRVQARQAAAAGGKASVKKRKELFGTAQPRSSSASSDASSDASTSASGNDSAALRGEVAIAEPTAEANAVALPNSEDSVQRASREEVARASLALLPLPLKPPRKKSVHEDWWDRAQAMAQSKNPHHIPEQVAHKTLNEMLKAVRDKHGGTGLDKAWRNFLEDKGAGERGWPLRLFLAQFTQHLNANRVGSSATNGIAIRRFE